MPENCLASNKTIMSNRPTPKYYEQLLQDSALISRRRQYLVNAVNSIGNAAYALYPDFDAVSVAESMPEVAAYNPVAEAERITATAVTLESVRPLAGLAQRETQRQLSENERYIEALRANVEASRNEDSHEFTLPA